VGGCASNGCATKRPPIPRQPRSLTGGCHATSGGGFSQRRRDEVPAAIAACARTSRCSGCVPRHAPKHHLHGGLQGAGRRGCPCSRWLCTARGSALAGRYNGSGGLREHERVCVRVRRGGGRSAWQPRDIHRRGAVERVGGQRVQVPRGAGAPPSQGDVLGAVGLPAGSRAIPHRDGELAVVHGAPHIGRQRVERHGDACRGPRRQRACCGFAREGRLPVRGQLRGYSALCTWRGKVGRGTRVCGGGCTVIA
jgi:hypothetical protein